MFSPEKRIDRLKSAIGDKFPNLTSFREGDIHKNVGISSTFQIFPGRDFIYSKCYSAEPYKDHPEYKRFKDSLVPNVHDAKAKLEKWEKEARFAQTLNAIEDEQNPSVKLSPRILGLDPFEKRIFEEHLKEGPYWPTLMDKFIELHENIDKCDRDKAEAGLGTINGKITQEAYKNAISEKREYVRKAMYYIARLHYLTDLHKDKFLEKNGKPWLRGRRKPEEVDMQCKYFARAILEQYPDKKFKNPNDPEEVYAFIKKERKVDIKDWIETLRESKRKFHHASRTGLVNRLRPIHGDLGPQHMTVQGVVYDFDKSRFDIPQDDLVRFLHSESAFPYAVDEHDEAANEGSVLANLKDYFLFLKIFEGESKDSNNKKLKEDNYAPDKRDELIERYGLEKDFRNFAVLYYSERLDEDIHIFGINYGIEKDRLERIVGGNKILSNVKDFQDFRVQDMNQAIDFLLKERYGRENILSTPTALRYFEDVGRFLRETGVLSRYSMKCGEDNR